MLTEEMLQVMDNAVVEYAPKRGAASILARMLRELIIELRESQAELAALRERIAAGWSTLATVADLCGDTMLKGIYQDHGVIYGNPLKIQPGQYVKARIVREVEDEHR